MGKAVTVEEKLKVVCTAFDSVLTGGNSLASNLIGILGAGEKNFPPYGTPYEEVQKLFAKRFPKTWINYYEQWVCWNACMEARDMVEKKLGKGWKKWAKP